ncbi:MAG: hypothetical protein M0Z59_10075 [Nitrospiraceae bacterium]|nr:hypothetical protein [Nitrospiraceae bacterium]
MKFTKVIKDESGIALVIVLLLSAVALMMMSALIYMTLTGTQVAGMQGRYSNVLEAGMGGVSAATQLIASGGAATLNNVNETIPNNACLAAKLVNSTANWPAGCGASSKSWIINSTDNATYDMSVDLGNYRVYTKVVDTIAGNTGGVPGLVKTGVVSSNTGDVPVASRPSVYTMEVLSQSQTNPSERSRLSVIYEY